jgi:hypothetical protein
MDAQLSRKIMQNIEDTKKDDDEFVLSLLCSIFNYSDKEIDLIMQAKNTLEEIDRKEHEKTCQK